VSVTAPPCVAVLANRLAAEACANFIARMHSSRKITDDLPPGKLLDLCELKNIRVRLPVRTAG
jgi:hypothetical protein